MTLFFNIENLEKEAPCDPNRFVALLHAHYYGVMPRKYRNVKQAKLSLVGNSFLLNPEPLFKIKIESVYIVQYIKLAARRDYGFYSQYGVKSLPLSYFPDINLENIKSNPLLNITSRDIHFLFEENKRK